MNRGGSSSEAMTSPAELRPDDPEGIAALDIHQQDARLVVEGVPDRPGTAAAIFCGLEEAGIDVGLIVETVNRDGSAALTFTLPETQRHKAFAAVQPILAALGGSQVVMQGPVTTLRIRTLAGGHRRRVARFFQGLAAAGINIQMINAAERETTVVLAPDDADRAKAIAAAVLLGRGETM